MVALNTAYAAPKNAADPKNRAGDFFHEDHASVGKNRWASRLNTQEKSCYHYETASGRSNWVNRDPLLELGHQEVNLTNTEEHEFLGSQVFEEDEENLFFEINRYGFVFNNPFLFIDPNGESPKLVVAGYVGYRAWKAWKKWKKFKKKKKKCKPCSPVDGSRHCYVAAPGSRDKGRHKQGGGCDSGHCKYWKINQDANCKCHVNFDGSDDNCTKCPTGTTQIYSASGPTVSGGGKR
jgi:hypothetical protein